MFPSALLPSRRHPPYGSAFAKRFETAMRLKKQPCCADDLMLDPPPTDWDHLRRPQLRKCPFDITEFEGGLQRLSGGMDGCVWKLDVAGRGPCTLKVSWDNEPPPAAQYWAFQRECQNAAILQTVEAAIQKEPDAQPIWIHGQPSTYQDAVDNLFAVSDEGRSQQALKTTPGAMQLTTTFIPRFKKCFGWLKVDCQQLQILANSWQPLAVHIGKTSRQMHLDQTYFAILYEYIPEGESDAAAVQSQIDFFRRMGFDFSSSPQHENWKSGMLVDYSDIVSPWGYGWCKTFYRCRKDIQVTGFFDPGKTSRSRDFMPQGRRRGHGRREETAREDGETDMARHA